MRNFFNSAFQILPHPIKSFQRYFQIEQEIIQVKTYFRPYRFSLFLFFGILSYPLLKPFVIKYAGPTKDRIVKSFSALNQNKIEASSKEIVLAVLNDPKIKREGGLYVEKLVKEQVVKDAVIKLLEITVKDSEFIKSSKELAKDISLDLIKDKELEEKLAQLTLRILQNNEIKQETSNLIKWVMLQEESKEKVVELLKSGFEDDRLRNALTTALGSSFYEIMNMPETIEKLKMFSYFLMENDPEESENVRNMIDTIVDKIVNKKREESRRSELDIILNTNSEDIPKQEKDRTHKKEKVL